jgi:hypothetical protein
MAFDSQALSAGKWLKTTVGNRGGKQIGTAKQRRSEEKEKQLAGVVFPSLLRCFAVLPCPPPR